MKKILLLFLGIILLSGCQKEEYELFFDEKSILNCTGLVYEFKDGTRVYTDYANVKYKKDNVEMTVTEALEKGLLNINDIKKYEEFKIVKANEDKPLGCID